MSPQRARRRPRLRQQTMPPRSVLRAFKIEEQSK
jgi:hypothetical protein